MGMFDTLTCEYPLPMLEAQNLEFQTKSLICGMDDYKIDKLGELWHMSYDTEDQSDPNAKGIARMFGCMTRINRGWERENFTGEIRFYASLNDSYENWQEFSSYFINGKIKHLVQIFPKID